jgi:hypothetical protein
MAIPQQPLVSALIALQFISFGWRLNREITVGDGKRKTWLPLPDYLNVLSLFAIISICVVIPLAGGKCDRLANAALVVGYALIAFHPINEASHYRLFSGKGRSVYLSKSDGDYPWITDQEIFSVILTFVVASIAWYVAWHA